MVKLTVTIAALSVAISANYRGCHALLLHQPTALRASYQIHRHATSPTAISRNTPYHSLLIFAATSDTTPNDAETTKSNNSILTNSKLIYFGIPGRAEAIRLALAISGVEFEDKRIPFPVWGKVKPTTPWGTVPVLELADGSQLAQARSILRFVGKHTGLYPINDDDDDYLVAQRIDELMDALEDLGDTITNTGRDLPKDELETARRTAISDGGAIYKYLAKIDAFIGANGDDGHAVGSEMTIASILTFTNLGRLVGGVYFGVPPTVCDPFPNIQRVRKTVGCDPRVVAWYDARASRQKSLSPAEQVLMGCRDL